MNPLSRTLRLHRQIPVRTRATRYPQKRCASRSSYNEPGENVQYRAVRFQTPRLNFRRIATIGLYTGAIYAYLQFVGRFVDIQVELLEGIEDVGEKEKADDKEDDPDSPYARDDSTFIPLTWSTKLPKTYYRGSDPEWQEFLKVARDKDRHRRIHEGLVQIVFKGSIQHPSISRYVGKDPKVGKWWLDTTFPDGPPQEFERGGIEIGDDFLAWSYQKVSAENQWRLMRALWPQAAFGSLWATWKMLVNMQYQRVKEALGWEDNDSSSPINKYRRALETMQKSQKADQDREPKNIDKAQTDPNANLGAVVRGAMSGEGKSTQSTKSDGKRMPWQIQLPVPYSPVIVNSDIPIAMHVFESTLRKSWNPKKMEPPRGAFAVSGLVEVSASRGRVLLDVLGFFNPQLNKFVFVQVGVRNLKLWNQAPKGGP